MQIRRTAARQLRVGAIATIATILAACGSSGASGGHGAGDPAGPAVVVWVGNTAITKAMLEHAMVFGATRKVIPGNDEQVLSNQALRRQQLGSLISYEWVVDEAADKGIAPSNSTVERLYAKETAQSFRSKAALQKYLRESHETPADMKLGIRLELASEALRKAVIGPAASDPEATQQEIMARFIKGWRAKWRAKTNCKPGYVVQKCRQFKPSASVPAEQEDPYALN